ncbi:MurR/RpiR family transcriptional regulator [Treponema sp. OMZ 840]|uniref:MurR/RpiR family transcriptional regulator n=1 Tax=Treponema sp. OMZ 840 TaxID=244313 RepID=UPI003D89DCFE
MKDVTISKTPLWEIHIRSSLNKLSSSETKVAQYVLNMPKAVLNKNIRELAEAARVSEATVVRFFHRVGYTGLKKFKAALTQEYILNTGRIPDLRKLDESDTIENIKNKVFYGCIDALSDTMDVLDIKQLSQAVDALTAAPYVEVFGMGGAAAVARSALHSFRKLGIRINMTTSFNFEYLQMAHFNKGDVVLAISRSGETKDIVETVRIAKQKGAVIISISNIQESALSKLSDYCLVSTSGTYMLQGDSTYERIAQFAVLHALYAGVAMRKKKDVSDE